MENIFQKMKKFFGEYEIAVLENKSRWIVKPESESIGYLKAMNAKGCHIFIKPCDESCFMLCDDIGMNHLIRQHRINKNWKPGRMVTETSTGNFQVWIKTESAVSYEEKRFWLKKMNSDPGADPKTRWGRCPGFFNKKPKHRRPDGSFPLAKLIWIDWKNRASVPGRTMDSEKLSHLPPAGCPETGKERGGECAYSLSRNSFTTGDESRTDFRYVLWMIGRGYPDETIRNRLMSERTEWGNHAGKIEAYIERTLKNARRIHSGIHSGLV